VTPEQLVAVEWLGGVFAWFVFLQIICQGQNPLPRTVTRLSRRAGQAAKIIWLSWFPLGSLSGWLGHVPIEPGPHKTFNQTGLTVCFSATR
jgi:hypothetical protein